MPQFAANLSMLYPELPFLQRFGAAAADGFTGVEYLFPYEHATADIDALLHQHGLEQVLFNAPPGGADRSRMAAAGDAGKRAAMVMMGVVVMLFFAGLLEGFGRQLITNDYARLSIAAGMFTLWVSYFGLIGREARNGAA